MNPQMLYSVRMSNPHEITFFAQTLFRNQRDSFGILQPDRRSHIYLIGRTGTGKSTLLETMVRQDLRAGRGLCLIDPHGDFVEKLLTQIPPDRMNDLIYFDVPVNPQGLAFNPFDGVPADKRSLTCAGLVDTFRMLWEDSWGPRLEYILRNALLVLMDQPSATLADVSRLLTDATFRKQAAWRTENIHVRNFWLNEYEKYSFRFRTEAIMPIQNKVGAFLSDPVLNKILTASKTSLNLRRLIDERKILLVNLSKGKIGTDATALMGALLVQMLGLAALSRADQPEEKRQDFHLYLDEFQTFTTLGLANMLSELRKYRLCMVLAHQYISQLDNQVRDAILCNAGTIIAFRLGLPDAERLAGEFYPVFAPSDIVNLANYHIYLKLMINGAVSKPFSATTLSRPPT
jgi:type IV secretory pathway TraG/TraD family ATPase VirD4